MLKRQRMARFSQTGSSLVMTLVVALCLEAVMLYTVSVFVGESRMNAQARRATNRTLFAANLQTLFSDSDQCVAFLNAQMNAGGINSAALAGPHAATSISKSMSPGLNALTSSGSLQVWQAASLGQLGPAVSDSTATPTAQFLTQWTKSHSGATSKEYGFAMFASYQPWWLNPNSQAQKAGLTSPPTPGSTADSAMLQSDYRLNEGGPNPITATSFPDSTNPTEAYISMLDQDVYISRMTIIETDLLPVPGGTLPGASYAPPLPYLNKPSANASCSGYSASAALSSAGMPGLCNPAPGFSRAFHVWFDFGIAVGSSVPVPSGMSMLDLAAVTADGTPFGKVVSCVPFRLAVTPQPNIATNFFSLSCASAIVSSVDSSGKITYSCQNAPNAICPSSRLPTVSGGSLSCL